MKKIFPFKYVIFLFPHMFYEEYHIFPPEVCWILSHKFYFFTLVIHVLSSPISVDTLPFSVVFPSWRIPFAYNLTFPSSAIFYRRTSYLFETLFSNTCMFPNLCKMCTFNRKLSSPTCDPMKLCDSSVKVSLILYMQMKHCAIFYHQRSCPDTFVCSFVRRRQNKFWHKLFQ